MFARVTLFVSDLTASGRFYCCVLPVLGLAPEGDGMDWPELSLAPAAGRPPTTRLHLGLTAGSHDLVDRFWKAGVQAAYRDDGAPGPRPQYAAEYYGAFLLDPDGNSIEAVHNPSDRSPGAIDHVWIRVRHLERSAAFYEELGAVAGFAAGWRGEDPPRIGFASPTGTFSLVDGGPPTSGLRIAFTAPGEASETVDPDGNEVALVRSPR